MCVSTVMSKLYGNGNMGEGYLLMSDFSTLWKYDDFINRVTFVCLFYVGFYIIIAPLQALMAACVCQSANTLAVESHGDKGFVERRKSLNPAAELSSAGAKKK